eukprot:3574371-Rhodomonas_salina.1
MSLRFEYGGFLVLTFSMQLRTFSQFCQHSGSLRIESDPPLMHARSRGVCADGSQAGEYATAMMVQGNDSKDPWDELLIAEGAAEGLDDGIVDGCPLRIRQVSTAQDGHLHARDELIVGDRTQHVTNGRESFVCGVRDRYINLYGVKKRERLSEQAGQVPLQTLRRKRQRQPFQALDLLGGGWSIRGHGREITVWCNHSKLLSPCDETLDMLPHVVVGDVRVQSGGQLEQLLQSGGGPEGNCITNLGCGPHQHPQQFHLPQQKDHSWVRNVVGCWLCYQQYG